MIFKRVTIDNVTSLNVYDNPTFSSQFIVFCQGREYFWLTLKTSSIKNSGLGVFLAHSFKSNEFVMFYLSVPDLEPQGITYTFKKMEVVTNSMLS
jgi:hypothetical protein